MKSLITAIYYTSNRENEKFERNIRNRILTQTSFMHSIDGKLPMPIISVSQKPIDFGKNICVGKKYPCDINIWRQKLIACKAATTPFVITTEADCLYPPEYFQYIPRGVNQHHRYLNVWILEKNKDMFYRKESTEGAEIVGRELYIKQIEKALKGKPEWATKKDAHTPGLSKVVVLWKRGWKPWEGKNAVISIKTGHGIRAHAAPMRGWTRTAKLPYWGSIEKVKKEMFG